MIHSHATIRYDAAVELLRKPAMTDALPRLLPAILAIALYAISLYGTYVYDDRTIVYEDPRVRHVQQWGQLWTRDYFNGAVDNLYRPIVSSSYAIEWFIHGDRPWFFHAINIFLHALVCMLVAEFVQRVLGTRIENRGSKIEDRAAPASFLIFDLRPSTFDSRANLTALYAGLLFAMHPIH